MTVAGARLDFRVHAGVVVVAGARLGFQVSAGVEC